VVTIGAGGALVADGGTLERVPAPAVDVVDTTGAGDAFNGTLACELAGGAALLDAVRRAVAVAAESTRVAGARG
jgi:ribokinase